MALGTSKVLDLARGIQSKTGGVATRTDNVIDGTPLGAVNRLGKNYGLLTIIIGLMVFGWLLGAVL